MPFGGQNYCQGFIQIPPNGGFTPPRRRLDPLPTNMICPPSLLGGLLNDSTRPFDFDLMHFFSLFQIDVFIYAIFFCSIRERNFHFCYCFFFQCTCKCKCYFVHPSWGNMHGRRHHRSCMEGIHITPSWRVGGQGGRTMWRKVKALHERTSTAT